MKYVLFYAPATEPARIRELFPAHQAAWKAFVDRGELLMIGPFVDPGHGAMAVFRSREAAREFLEADPFVREGVVSHWELREWREAVIPETPAGPRPA